MNSLLAANHPPQTMCVAKLFKAAFDGVDLKPLRARTLMRAQADPFDAAARMDLCVMDQLLGDQASGLKWQREALQLQRIYRSSWPVSRQALRVLAFLAPGDIGTNTPIDFLLQDLDVVLYSLYMVPGQPLPDTLPDHDVAIVTSDDSDLNRSVLQDIDSLLPMWPCAVLNRPDRVVRLSRETMYTVLRSVPGLAMPPTVRVTRTMLALGAAMPRDIAPEMRFPLIIRPVDSHAGRGLTKLDGSSSISTYLSERNEAEFVISPFIDYRSSDGLFRKYRIIWVDGDPYPCHLGISDDWKVWYYNAGMALSAAKRTEEAEFMADFHHGFAWRHADALDAIVNEFGLEYMGIDCAEMPDGRLLLFEGSISLVAHDMDPPTLYPYKSPQMQKLFASFYEMLKRKSSIGSVCRGGTNLIADLGLKNELASSTLDPEDWAHTRELAHQMLDDMFDYVEHVRERPVWQPIPSHVRKRFRDSLPVSPNDVASVYRDFTELILPFTVGNVHPGFMGWVHGGGSVVGMLAEMLAGGLNANVAGRDQIPVEVERQITQWMREIFGFPESATGLFVNGTSIANFVALLIARNAARKRTKPPGSLDCDKSLVAYTSLAAHHCIAKAMEMCGLGRAALRCIATDEMHQIRIPDLQAAIAIDRKAGLTPFLIVGTAGTVDIGAIDPLDALREIASEESMWFHVDGAFGALAILAPDLAPRLKGIELADSIAFDFHKWAQVPYDAGFVLVRDGRQHFETFATPAAYLRRELRGTAAGAPWPCDFGPDLSRGFRALKTWFTLKVYGTNRLGSVISRTCALARYLKRRVEETFCLELAAPVQLNIVCFRYRASDAVNAEIVADIQESGIAVPSSTTIDGRFAIRAAIVNHRTQPCDIDALVDAVVKFGRERTRADRTRQRDLASHANS